MLGEFNAREISFALSVQSVTNSDDGVRCYRTVENEDFSLKVMRLATNPIIFPEMGETIGTNINGPSLIRVPEWVKSPLGRYYLYFAHHHGKFIRLAYSDHVEGPWQIHAGGCLRLDQTPCSDHIASPDVHVDQKNRRIIMYYHGVVHGRKVTNRLPLLMRLSRVGGQCSLAATSPDGIRFTSCTHILGPSYFRVFYWFGHYYALGMPGQFLRSTDGLTSFEGGPVLFNKHMRHAALKTVEDTLYVFYSVVGSCPEHIVFSRIKLTPNWLDWKATLPETVLLPERDFEGGDLKSEISVHGGIHHRVKQLRDPAIFEENNQAYLLYSIAGESGIAVAELIDLNGT